MSASNGAGEAPTEQFSVTLDGTAPRSLGIHELLRVLGRRKWSILATSGTVFGLVLFVTGLLPPRYQSTVTFLLDRQSDQGNEAFDVLERVGRPASLQSEIGLMSGRRSVSRVVDDLHLHVQAEVSGEPSRPGAVLADFDATEEAVAGRYSLRPNADSVTLYFSPEAPFWKEADESPVVTGGVGQYVGANGLAFTIPAVPAGEEIRLEVVLFSAAIEDLRGRLNIRSATGDAEFVELVCEAGSAELVYQICRQIGDSYLRIRTGLQQSAAGAAAETLRAQVDAVGSQLQAAEDDLGTYEARNQMVAIEDRASEGVRQYARLHANRLELDAERNALSHLIASVDSASGNTRAYRDIASFPTFIRAENQAVSRLVASLVQLEDRRNELRLGRSESNVDVINVENRIREVERQLRGFALSYRDALGAQIASLAEALTTSSGELAQIPRRQIELARLQRQSTSLMTLKAFLQRRLQEAEVAQAMELPVVRVVDEAYLPFEPSYPNVPINVAAGLLLALASGLMVGFWKEATDSRIREGGELATLSDAPVLGLIPRMRHPGPVCRISAAAESQQGRSPEAISEPRKPTEGAIALEAFRNIIGDARFLVAAIPNLNLKTIAVVSAGRGDGKTLCASNLAIAHTSLGTNTLLIDADVRAKGVGRFFDIAPNQVGFTDALAQNVHWRDTVHHFTADHRRGLDVMPSGTMTSKVAELLSDTVFDDLIRAATGEYGVVIVDTPPLTILTDGLSVAAKADGVILVARDGVTTRADVDHAVQRLQRANARVLGVVLNGTRVQGYAAKYAYPAVYAK